MEVHLEHPKPWNIPRELARAFRKSDLEHSLKQLNPIGGGHLYFVDYYQKRLIVGSSPDDLALCGYPKELIEQEGIDFYKRILAIEEIKWLIQMNKEALKLYYKYPENERRTMTLYFSLAAKNIEGEKIFLHHKLFPYRLDKNGNIWLSLCFVSMSLFKDTNSASIVNVVGNEKYKYLNSVFQLSEFEDITKEEIKILSWMVNDFTSEEMCSLLKISDSSFKRKRQRMFKKFNVQTAAAAVHKAHLLGIF